MEIIINNNNCLVDSLDDYFNFSIDFADKCLYGVCLKTKKEKIIYNLVEYNIDNRRMINLTIFNSYIKIEI